MPDYVRPSPAPREFVDADGVVVRYGERWGSGSPPGDTYSVTSNLERFAPLHAVADALIDWLATSYDVTVQDSLDVAADLLHPPSDAVRAVRVRPADEAASPLTFVFTSFPGIHLHLGLLHDAVFPSCGCDACDETWERCADELEETVVSVVSGGLSESIRGPGQLPVTFRLESAGGWRGGSSRRQDYPRDRWRSARRALKAGRVWAPWPVRER